MTTPQRVDVETALAEVIRLADVADQLSGDYHESNRAEADLEWAAVNFVREHAKHIAALLQQLAEAERAREEACAIFAEVIDTVRDAATDARINHHDKRGEYHDKMADRIAAFLAANAPTHSAGGE